MFRHCRPRRRRRLLEIAALEMRDDLFLLDLGRVLAARLEFHTVDDRCRDHHFRR